MFITTTQILVGLNILFLNQVATGLNINSDLLKDSQTQCKSHYNGTILHHPHDCHKFFVCVNRQPQEYNCESNFHFDRNSRSCVPGNECDNINDIVQLPACLDGTINAVADDCYMFETCINGHYQKLNCPSGYYFYAPLAVCRPIQYNAHYKCNCVVPEHTVLQNRDNCQTYFVCKGRNEWLHKCEEGQYYEPSVNTCLPDLEGVCVMEPTKEPPKVKATKYADTLNEDTAKTSCEHRGKGLFSFSSFEGNCNKFQMCLNGQLFIKDCPEGLYFDDSRKYCVMDTKNICQNGRIITEALGKLKESEILQRQKQQESAILKKQQNIMFPRLDN